MLSDPLFELSWLSSSQLSRKEVTTLQPLHQFQEIIEVPTFTAGDAFANSLSWPPPSVIVPTYFFQLSPSTFFQCLYNHRYEAGKEIGKKKMCSDPISLG